MTASEITREGRRVETWIAIHQAAATLASRDGLAHATVNAIAEKAGISRRTFFNYFPTKEDAVLGLGPPEVPAMALADFQASDRDILSGLVHLMLAVSLSITRVAPDSSQRRQMIEQLPELRLRIQHHTRAAESLVEPFLIEKLGIEPGDDDTTVQALQMLAGTIVRFAFSRYSNHSDITTANVDSAIESFRNILKDIR